MKINYITQQKNAYHKMMELQVSPTERAVYMALFMIWNESGWKKTISVNRQEVMALSGVGSKVTYTNCLKKLDELEFIKYNPSHNPLIGSTIEMYNLCTSNEQVVDKLCTSSGSGSGSGSDTLLKLLNYKTIKLIEDNASLVEDNLETWIKDSKKIEVDENDTCLSFDDFWEMYDKKTGSRTKNEKKYSKIPEQDRQKIKNTLPLYLDSTPDKKYRKHPMTYLNNESWNDEIIGLETEIKPKKGDTMNIWDIMRKQAEEEKRQGLC